MNTFIHGLIIMAVIAAVLVLAWWAFIRLIASGDQ